MIKLIGVNKSYDGESVLKGLSVELPDDDITYLTTPSGSGKTTILRLILGLEKPDSGEIIIQNAKLTAVFQEDRLIDFLSAVKNVALCTNTHKPRHIEEALERVGLTEEDIKKPVRDLSGGQARRVALVRGMETDFTFALLDEPFKGLDEKNRQLAQRYIREKLHGKGALIVTHDTADTI